MTLLREKKKDPFFVPPAKNKDHFLHEEDLLSSMLSKCPEYSLAFGGKTDAITWFKKGSISDETFVRALGQLHEFLEVVTAVEEFTFGIFTNPDEGWLNWFNVLDHTAWASPFQSILTDCRDNHYLDLSMSNVPVNLPKPLLPLRACTLFISDEQRVCTLVVGTTEEQDFADVKYHSICEHNYTGYLVKNSSTTWTGDTMKTHGIPADQTPTHYWLVAKLTKDDESVTPLTDVGETCSLYFPKIAYARHALPTVKATPPAC